MTRARGHVHMSPSPHVGDGWSIGGWAMVAIGFARLFATKSLASPVKVFLALLAIASQLALRYVPHTDRTSALPRAFPSVLLASDSSGLIRG